MPYVKRNASGDVVQLSARPQQGAVEYLPNSDPAVAAYRGEDLPGLRSKAIGQLTAAANREMLFFIPKDAGLRWRFDQLYIEAREAEGNPAPAPRDHVLLTSHVSRQLNKPRAAVTAPEIASAVPGIISDYLLVRQAVDDIDLALRNYENQINNATTAVQINGILARATWP